MLQSDLRTYAPRLYEAIVDDLRNAHILPALETRQCLFIKQYCLLDLSLTLFDESNLRKNLLFQLEILNERILERQCQIPSREAEIIFAENVLEIKQLRNEILVIQEYIDQNQILNEEIISVLDGLPGNTPPTIH